MTRGFGPRNYWCQLGSLVLLVVADDVTQAADLAHEEFRKAGHHRARRDDVTARPAHRRDVARWRALQEQQVTLAEQIKQERQAQRGEQPGML